VAQLARPQAGQQEGQENRELPIVARLDEGALLIRGQQLHRPGRLNRNAVDLQHMERVFGVRGQVPPLGRVVEQRPAAFQNEPHPLIHQRPLDRVRMPVRRHVDGAKVAHELLGVSGLEQGSVACRAQCQEQEQVIGRGPVPMDGLNRRPHDLFVVFEPASAQVRDGNRLEAEHGRGADFKLTVDLGGELTCGDPVRTNPGPAAAAVFVITEVPNAAAEKGGDLADAERFCRGHDILREPSRHKTPQKAPQTGVSEEVSE
jgi:hypothetical protein